MAGKGFNLSDTEWRRADEFMNMKRSDTWSGPIGGQFTYEFTMTIAGCIVKIRDNLSNDVCDITEYEMF